jgi:hypothetical protein
MDLYSYPNDRPIDCRAIKVNIILSSSPNRKKKMKKLIVIAMCVIITVGCSQIHTPAENNNVDLLSDKTCDKPCVLGLTPGLTTQSEAWAIVNNNTLLSDCEGHDLRAQGGVQWIDCNSKSFNIVFSDNTVNWISIALSSLSVNQLIQIYGPPDALSIFISSRPDKPYRSQATLVYNKIQVQVTMVEESGNKYEVTPSTQVEAITFNSEKEQASVAATVLGSWKGYGIYSP